MRNAIRSINAEQSGADQPAIAPESKSNKNYNPNPGVGGALPVAVSRPWTLDFNVIFAIGELKNSIQTDGMHLLAAPIMDQLFDSVYFGQLSRIPRHCTSIISYEEKPSCILLRKNR